MLEKAGELDDTLIVVTSDHGMPFPRVKGQIYEPASIFRWRSAGAGTSSQGRTVTDFINVRDFAPTSSSSPGAAAEVDLAAGASLDVLKSEKSGQDRPARNRMVIGKERHDLGRPNDRGYPVRAIRTPEYLYVRNYEPDRWPVGNPETGYPNCDNGPTKTLITSGFDEYYRLCFGKRPPEELYRVTDDPDCVKNLAAEPGLRPIKQRLREEMERTLVREGDPRRSARRDLRHL